MTPWLTPDPLDPLPDPAARKEQKGRIRQLLGWLGDREHQLQMAVEAAELGLWHWNPATGELVWSDRCRALLGVAADAPASFETFQSLIHPDDCARVASAIDAATQNRTAYSVEYRIVLADDTIRWLHSLGRARYVATRDTPASMSGVVRDVTANHRASEAWSAQRHYLQQLMQAAPMGVAKLDLQLRFLSVNKVFAEGLRLDGHALTGRHLYEVLPEIPASWRAEFERGLAGTGMRAEVEPFARADGSIDWVARQVHPWHDERNEIGGILLVTDISTQRRHIESREQLWANAFTHNAHGMAIIDPLNFSLRCANAAYAGLLGRMPGQLSGASLAALYPEPVCAELRAAMARAEAMGRDSVAIVHRHQDGTLIPTQLDLVAVRDTHSAVPCLIATVTDLREHLRAQAQLRQQQDLWVDDRRFRLLADSAPLAIALSDPQGILTYANPAWLALTAVPLGQALDRDWCEFVHPDDRERVQSACSRLRHGASPALEFRYRRPGGEVRWVQAHCAPLRDAAGQALGHMRASVDITDSLQERAATDRVHSQARALAQRLQQLRDVERNEIAGSLQEGVFKGLARLSSGLRELSQPGVAESQLRQAPQELADLATATLDSLRRIVSELTPPGVGELGFEAAMERLVNEQSGRAGRQIVLSLPDKPLEVHQWTLCVLHEVAREAIANAVQHARAARIEVQVELRGDTVRMRVRDDGQGMRDKDRSKPGCFGLLAAAERLAQIGGTLRVVSVRAEGTTIEASAPLGPHARAPGDPGAAL
jgi:PAS domain S-box-containing protein